MPIPSIFMSLGLYTSGIATDDVTSSSGYIINIPRHSA